MRRLESERLVLEPVTPQNAGVLWQIMQGPRLREFQDVPRYTRDELAKRVLARPRAFDARAVGRFEWLLVPRPGSEAVGWVSLRVGDHSRGTAEIGYSLLEGHRGSGHASDAALLVVDFAFEQPDLQRIEACCMPENAASRALLARTGFSELRTQRSGAIVRGKPVDIVLFELRREARARAAEAARGAADGARAVTGRPRTRS